MKKLFIIILLLTSVQKAFCLEPVMDSIATKFCNCFPSTIDTSQRADCLVKVVECLNFSLKGYTKELKNAYGLTVEEIVFDESNKSVVFFNDFRALIEKKCPTTFVNINLLNKIALDNNENREINSIETNAETIRGTVTQITKEPFIVFTVNNELNEPIRYYWMPFIEANFDLSAKYKDLIGKSVHITFEVYKFFDSKLKDYRNYNVITKIEKVSN